MTLYTFDIIIIIIIVVVFNFYYYSYYDSIASPGGERMSTMCLAVLAQCKSVTDRQTPFEVKRSQVKENACR